MTSLSLSFSTLSLPFLCYLSQVIYFFLASVTISFSLSLSIPLWLCLPFPLFFISISLYFCFDTFIPYSLFLSVFESLNPSLCTYLCFDTSPPSLSLFLSIPVLPSSLFAFSLSSSFFLSLSPLYICFDSPLFMSPFIPFSSLFLPFFYLFFIPSPSFSLFFSSLSTNSSLSLLFLLSFSRMSSIFHFFFFASTPHGVNEIPFYSTMHFARSCRVLHVETDLHSECKTFAQDRFSVYGGPEADSKERFFFLPTRTLYFGFD